MIPKPLLDLITDVARKTELVGGAYAKANDSHRLMVASTPHLELVSGNVTLGRVLRGRLHQD